MVAEISKIPMGLTWNTAAILTSKQLIPWQSGNYFFEPNHNTL